MSPKPEKGRECSLHCVWVPLGEHQVAWLKLDLLSN